MRLLHLIPLGCLVLVSCGKGSANSQVKVVNGMQVGPTSIPPSVVAMVMTLQGANGSCSATHIGNGILITAEHCTNTLLSGPRSFVVAVDSRNQLVTKMEFENCQILRPEATAVQHTFDGQGHPVDVHLPDIVALNCSASIKSAIAHYPKAAVSSADIDIASHQMLLIAGSGQTDYNPNSVPVGPAATGFPNPISIGQVYLSSSDDLRYVSLWNDGQAGGGASWGDSGGPLLRATSNLESGGGFELLGVMADIKILERDDQGRATKVQTTYMKTSAAPVRHWLESAIAPLIQ